MAFGIDNQESILAKCLNADRRQYLRTPLVSPRLFNWVPYQLNAQLGTLLRYFETMASESLTVLGFETSNVLSLVLRMALSVQTPATAAVLQSIFALSALHRDGPNEQSAHLKVRALGALASSATGDINSIAAAQHVVCGLLLCTFELQKNAGKSYHWLWYVCGAKHLIKTHVLDGPGRGSDLNLVVGWAQYYEVMARFGLRHWRRENTAEFAFAEYAGHHAALPPVCARDHIVAELNNPPTAMLDLLREVIDIAEAHTPSHRSSSGYGEYALELESKLKETYRTLREQQLAVSEDQKAVVAFGLSVLLYLWRLTDTSRNITSTKVASLIDEAFGYLSELDALRYPLPMLLLGCEARTDNQRRIILELISRTERISSTQAMSYVKGMTRSAWVQEDLRRDGSAARVGYMEMLNVLISSCKRLPTFI
ncbi:hypothetical protein LEL_00096 [Akanthomyces lecanii RCEF 1005]|uniref:Fungal transcriptional regulatory protein n=1 Tax=Akanthomyces lecanii RCEF 1005 TaxID=1081108 RepID=A0A168JK66_CORDF|nr:hypothetical protein LEL_00096 [Akanthomyces lecanii RCEF 1005]